MAKGDSVAIMDDDGQHPPEEVRLMYKAMREGNYDVVYGNYRVKQHGFLRNVGSRFNDRIANWMLKKPKDLYLSSFKIMNRFLVDEVTRYQGSFPYIDGLILRSTRNIGQVDVEHKERKESKSNYNIKKALSPLAEYVSELFDPASSDFGCTWHGGFCIEFVGPHRNRDRQAVYQSRC